MQHFFSICVFYKFSMCTFFFMNVSIFYMLFCTLLFFFLPVNNLVFYLPKVSCYKHWGPKTSRRDGVGEPSCLPGAVCPILLPAGDGRVDKVYTAPSSISSILCINRSVMSDSATPWTVAHQAPLSKGFSRQEYWSGLPFLSLTPLSLSILYRKLFTL